MRKLILFDVDSTLINEEVIDLLAAKVGKEVEVSAITEAAMAGEIDFAQALKRRVSLLKGSPLSVITEVQAEISLTKGASELISALKEEGHVPAVVSGGFTSVIEPLMLKLGISHYRANNLEISAGLLTGKVSGVIIDRFQKAQALLDFASNENILLEATVAIGDGANDIEMIEKAGLGIAFCAKPALIEVADVSITNRDLLEVLKYI